MGAASCQLKPAVLGEDLAISLSEIIARDDTYVTARGTHAKVREKSSTVVNVTATSKSLHFHTRTLRFVWRIKKKRKYFYPRVNIRLNSNIFAQISALS